MRFKIHPSQPKDFRSLAEYLPGKGGKDRPERVAWKYARNLSTDEQELAAEIMEATAAQNTRCKNPAYHFMVSFDPKDAKAGKITEAAMREIAEDIVKRMGLSEYQALIYAHHDKDHPHIHFLVNRIHPGTLKAYSRHEDGKRLHAVCRDIAKERGLNVARDAAEERALKQEAHKDKEKRQGRAAAQAQVPEQPADDPHGPEKQDDKDFWSAKRAGRIPMRRFSEQDIEGTKDAFIVALDDAESWDDLSRSLADRKLYLARKGQGLIVSDGERYAKLSEMGKGVRLDKLEERFEESFNAFTGREIEWKRRKEGRGAVPALDDADDEYRYWSALDETYRTTQRAIAGSESKMNNRAEWVQKHTDTARQSKSLFLMALALVYANNRSALRKWNELERRIGPKEAMAQIQAQPNILGNIKGLKYARGLSPKRKLAEKTFKKLMSHRARYTAAMNRVEFARNQYLEARRQFDLARHDFAMMQLRLGTPAQFQKIVQSKIRARYLALERVTEKMINEADVADEQRLQLIHAFRKHRRNKEKERQRALQRGRPLIR
jgi:hypothetical protein